MKKRMKNYSYLVTIELTCTRTYRVEASNADQANELVLEGQYDDVTAEYDEDVKVITIEKEVKNEL